MKFILAYYCHEFKSLLELAIPTIEKFICKNGLLKGMMKL